MWSLMIPWHSGDLSSGSVGPGKGRRSVVDLRLLEQL